MQPAPPCPAPACWWWMRGSGLLLCWQLQLDAYSMGFSPPHYVALWDSNTPHRPAGDSVSCCLETSPPSRLPLQDRSLFLNLLSLFLSFIFCPSSFWRERAAFLGAWCPLPVFSSCFVEVAQHSNTLLVNLWGRKWPPYLIPPPKTFDCVNHDKLWKIYQTTLPASWETCMRV